MTDMKPGTTAIKSPTPILLAAGMSQRMGGLNKLLLPINGVPMVRHVALTLAAFADMSPVVVLGHEAQQVAAALDGIALTTITNAQYQRGQMSSVTAGLIAAGQAADYMICLADLPLLTVADCAALFAAHKKAGVGQITVPAQREDGMFVRRGNPIIIPASASRKIIKGGTNLGCRGLLNNHPDLIYPFDSCADGFYVDIDTQDTFCDITGQKPDARMIVS
jgi:molybdenum cofactor cytidylyltransferase